MSNATPTAPRRGRHWLLYVTVGVFLVLGVALTVLAANGTLRRWFGGGDKSASSTGQLWTCGMHPQVIQDHPGQCPICHMDLTPLRAGTSPAGTDAMPSPGVTIDPVVVQNMGVRTAEVTRGPLETTVRAVGLLEEAEPNVYDVNLRLSGWVEKLYANTAGMHVREGDPLFELYSPQLQTAVEELIAARRAGSAPGGDQLSAKSTAALRESAFRKLVLLGLSEEQVEKLAAMDRAPRTVTFTSPITGHVTEKPVVEGAAVKEGERVLRIVDHSTLWLDARIYESQFPFIEQGQNATATVASLPGKKFEGEVVFVHPHVDPTTRTVMVRLVVPNESLVLRPGMYATVQIRSELADEAVLAPREAVIDTGTRQVAFLARGEGHFEPRAVRMGVMGQDGLVQVLEGLSPGEKVVTSGQFLIDAESRMKEAIQKHLRQKLGGPEPTQPQRVAQANPTQRPSATAPAAAPTTATSAVATTAPRESGGEQTPAAVDAVAKAYLDLSNFFGKPQQRDEPAEVRPLVDAAQELAAALPPETRALAEQVAKASSALEGHPVQHQRNLFKPLSAAVIALVNRVPPTASVADRLFVMHCPMADENRGADWLQTTATVANPYYATEMKRCGSVERTIDLPAGR